MSGEAREAPDNDGVPELWSALNEDVWGPDDFRYAGNVWRRPSASPKRRLLRLYVLRTTVTVTMMPTARLGSLLG